jgi:hypothetical protein
MGEFLSQHEYHIAINTEVRAMATNTAVSPTNGIISLVLGLLAVGLVFMVISGRDVPIVGNGAGVLLALGVIGMAMCALSGIGTVQGTLGWGHPVTIIGSILGVLALLIVVLPLVGVKLPMVADTRAAVLALSVIMLVKVGLMGVGRFIV